MKTIFSLILIRLDPGVPAVFEFCNFHSHNRYSAKKSHVSFTLISTRPW